MLSHFLWKYICLLVCNIMSVWDFITRFTVIYLDSGIDFKHLLFPKVGSFISKDSTPKFIFYTFLGYFVLVYFIFSSLRKVFSVKILNSILFNITFLFFFKLNILLFSYWSCKFDWYLFSSCFSTIFAYKFPTLSTY